MAPTASSWTAPDLAVLGVAGLTVAFALFGAWYAIPWRQRSRRAGTTKEFNVFWQGRATLEVFSAAWAACQILRLGTLWGSNSIILPAVVTDWTGSGWLCRVYLSAALGFFQPFCSIFTLVMLAAAVSRKHPPGEQAHPNRRLLGLALLGTLPVLAVQSAAAFVSLVLKYNGEPLERNPRSLLGWFFAAYWYGSTEQCEGEEGCTLCVFPAASVVAHTAFSAVYLIALWVTSARMAAVVLNKRLKRRLRFFTAADSLLVIAGGAAMGGSIVKGPFTWVNQGCWLGYFLSVVATVLLVSWDVVVWPVRDLSRLNKRLKLWMSPSEEMAVGPERDESDGYIKAVPNPLALEEEDHLHSAAQHSMTAAGLTPVPSVTSAPPAGIALGSSFSRGSQAAAAAAASPAGMAAAGGLGGLGLQQHHSKSGSGQLSRPSSGQVSKSGSGKSASSAPGLTVSKPTSRQDLVSHPLSPTTSF